MIAQEFMQQFVILAEFLILTINDLCSIVMFVMIPKVLNTAGLVSFSEKLNYVNFRQKDEMVLKWEKLLKPQNIIRFFHIQDLN